MKPRNRAGGMGDGSDGAGADFWVYPLKDGEELTSHDWWPFYGHRFLSSPFLIRQLAEGRRDVVATSMILTAEAMRQNPAGTLPDDDVLLSHLAQYGPDLARWQADRPRILADWRVCKVETEAEPSGYVTRLSTIDLAMIAKDMFKRKRGRETARWLARRNTQRKRLREKLELMQIPKDRYGKEALEALLTWLDEEGLTITPDNIRAGLELVLGDRGNITSLRGRGGR